MHGWMGWVHPTEGPGMRGTSWVPEPESLITGPLWEIPPKSTAMRTGNGKRVILTWKVNFSSVTLSFLLALMLGC
jgi:hypothetical protein